MWPDRAYSGEWLDDKPHGRGFMLKECTVYRGVFRAGELDQSQPVTVLYPNGDLY